MHDQYNNLKQLNILLLKEALASVCLSKRDMITFMATTLENHPVLDKLKTIDIASPMRKYAETLLLHIDMLPNPYELQSKLIDAILLFPNFDHLYYDDRKKAAEKAVNTLKEHLELIKYSQGMNEHNLRTKNQKEIITTKEKYSAEISKFYERFKNFPDEPKQRGYKFQEFIIDLFNLYDLQAKKSFRPGAEEIDGSCIIDHTNYLLEVKWVQNKIGDSDLSSFQYRVIKRLENTLGIFISFSGFSDGAIKEHSKHSNRIILINGHDIIDVLEERVDLLQMLREKKRRASDYGDAYHQVK
jgi:hypothetical protein